MKNNTTQMRIRYKQTFSCIRKSIIATLLLLTLAFLLPMTASTQENSPALTEKVVLQTDRKVYLAGDSIWFSARYTNSANKGGAPLSKVLYVDLIRNQQALARGKYRLHNGTVSGVLPVSQQVISGNYLLRAYTKYQRNMPEETFYTQLISIVNPGKPFPSGEKGSHDPSVSIAVKGGGEYPCRMNRYAVRTSPGFAADVKAAFVANSRGKKIQDFRLNRNGLGGFRMKPVDTAAYTCGFVTARNDTIRQSLPDFPKDSLFVRSKVSGKKLNVALEATSVWKTHHYEEALQIRLYDKDFRLLEQKEVACARFPAEVDFQLPDYTRIAFAVISRQNTCIEAHPFVMEAPRQKELKMLTDKSLYRSRSRVKLTMPGKNKFNWKWATLAVSRKSTGCDPSALPYEAAYRYSLLRSAMDKQPLDRATASQTAQALIMLDNQINTAAFCKNFRLQPGNGNRFIPDIREVSLAGKLVSSNSQTPLPQKDVFASVIGQDKQIHHYRTDSSGSFIFSLNHLDGRQNVLISTAPADSAAEFLIRSDFHQQYPESSAIPMLIDSTKADLVRKMYKGQQINYKMRSAVQDTQLYPQYPAVNFQGNARYTIRMDEYITLPNIQEVFLELVPYTRFVKSKGTYSMEVFSEQSRRWFTNPLLLLDYAPVYDIDKLMDIKPAKIKRIEVINSLYYIGDYMANGVVLILTKTNNFAGTDLPENYVHLRYAGYYRQKAPVFPVYAERRSIRQRRPDFRTTLFWHPSAQALPDTVTFYTSDNYGTYTACLRGVTKDGKHIFTAAEFLVKRMAE